MVNVRKVFAVTVVMLSCAFSYAQEKNDSGFSAGLSVIPRLEATLSDSSADDLLGNSSLYSLFESSFGSHFSVSICNHWLSSDPGALYKKTFYSDDVNWLDWANVSFTAGNFSITVGKDMVTTGGLEFDDYDFDVYPELCSGLWQNYACYQWGAKAAWEVPCLNSSFAFQFSTSPFGERPFKSNKYNYSLSWNGDFGPFRTIWSVTAVNGDSGRWEDMIPLAALGQSLTLGSWTLGLDLFSQVGNEEYILSDGFTVLPSVRFDPGDHWSFFAKGGIETVTDRNRQADDSWFAGIACENYPLNNRFWRLHSCISYNKAANSIFVSFGTIVYLNAFWGNGK